MYAEDEDQAQQTHVDEVDRYHTLAIHTLTRQGYCWVGRLLEE